MDAFGTPGELNRALIDGSMPVGNFASSAISAERAASMLGGLKQINQRGFAEGTGKKKAVFIGINYTGTESELRGCINDVRNMHAFIKGNFGFPDENMIILTDDNPNPSSMPVAQNILSALSWLVQDAAAGDSLFLHYSGHGGTARTMSGAVQTIIPLDFKNTGQISDVQLHELVCKRVPPGCQLTAIFDSCHSGSVLNLPYSLLPTAASDSSSFPSLLQINGNSGIGATLLGMLGSWASDPAMVGQLLSQLRPQGYSAMLGGREIVTNDAGVEAKQPKHTIQPGDTFWKLVQEGKAESVDVLLQCNPGVVPEMLMPGQVRFLGTSCSTFRGSLSFSPSDHQSRTCTISRRRGPHARRWNFNIHRSTRRHLLPTRAKGQSNFRGSSPRRESWCQPRKFADWTGDQCPRFGGCGDWGSA